MAQKTILAKWAAAEAAQTARGIPAIWMNRIREKIPEKRSRTQAHNGSEDPIQYYLPDRIFIHQNVYRRTG